MIVSFFDCQGSTLIKFIGLEDALVILSESWVSKAMMIVFLNGVMTINFNFQRGKGGSTQG